MQKRIIDNEIGDLREREGTRVRTEKAAKANARTTPNAKAVRKKPKRASAREGAPPGEANATEEAPRQEAEAKEDALREEDDAKEEAKSKAKAKPTRKAKAKAKAKSKAETLDAWIKKDTNKHEDTATAAASTAACLQQLQQMQQQKQQQRNLCFQGAEEETQRAKRPAPLLCEPLQRRPSLAGWHPGQRLWRTTDACSYSTFPPVRDSGTSTRQSCTLLPRGKSSSLENQKLAKIKHVQTLVTCKS